MRCRLLTLLGNPKFYYRARPFPGTITVVGFNVTVTSGP
jgi:hypothetical protein